MAVAFPAITKDRRAKAILLGCLAFGALYLFAGNVHFRPPWSLSPSLFDQAVPFVSWTVWVYLSQFVFLFLAIWLFDDAETRSRTFYAMVLATAIAGGVFLVWPTEIVRRAVDAEGLTGLVWQALYLIDPQTNCFPSLHVALASLAAARLATGGDGWRWLGPLWAALISLSTLTTKQHYAIDVLGGLVLAGISYLGIRRFVRVVA